MVWRLGHFGHREGGEPGIQNHDGMTEYQPRPSSSTIIAPFSAIIMVGELVLPDVIVGITDASITRTLARPISRNRSSTTAIGSSLRPIFAVPTG